MSVTRSKTPFKYNYILKGHTFEYRIQSSAKRRVCDDTAAGRSLINVRKRRALG
jgi:hypothetical protein